MMLIGNKLDMESSRQVDYQEGKEYADSLEIHFYEISMKTLTNFEDFCMQMFTGMLASDINFQTSIVQILVSKYGKWLHQVELELERQVL